MLSFAILHKMKCAAFSGEEILLVASQTTAIIPTNAIRRAGGSDHGFFTDAADCGVDTDAVRT